jgi:uridine kinase
MDNDGIQQKIIESIVPHIQNWIKDDKKIIIGIEGNSGAGKTTLSFYLNKIFPNSCCLSMDLFINDKKLNTKENLEYFSKNFFNIQQAEFYLNKFKNSKPGDIASFKIKNKNINIDLHKQILFLDGIFFSNNSIGSNYLDRNILLILDKKELIKRREVRSRKNNIKYNNTLATKLDKAWNEYYLKYEPYKKSTITLHLEILPQY